MKELPNEEETQLVEAAVDAREKAYAPYSDYKVGAAILSQDGKIYTGCNVENATYTVLHAERMTMAEAIKDGKRKFRTVAVATKSGLPPCGNCRQDLVEFGDLEVLAVDEKGNLKIRKKLSELLPDSFMPSSLKN